MTSQFLLSRNQVNRAVALVAVLVVVVVVLLGRAGEWHQFPETWNLNLREPLNEFKRVIVVNRRTHWVFLYLFEPLSSFLDSVIRGVEGLLLWLPWPVIVVHFFLLGNRIAGPRLGLLTTACLLLMGLFGLWDRSMETLALMIISVLISLLFGLPLGIWAGRNHRVDKLLRPLLDAMQTMPAFVYLIPVLLFFGVARVPSVIATVIYAVPPVIRLTSLGIRSVSPDAIEAARAFGSTGRQLLWKVQIPLAMPSILAGINQSIMMALSIVIIAALIGAGGLGNEVLKSLRRLRVGEALEAGLAIVVMAILLDRLSAALASMDFRSHNPKPKHRLFAGRRHGIWIVDFVESILVLLQRSVRRVASAVTTSFAYVIPNRWQPEVAKASYLSGSVLILLVLLGAGLHLGWDSFPDSWNLNISDPVNTLVKWMQVNLVEIGNTGLGTGPFRDFLIVRLFKPLVYFFTVWLSWPAIFFVFVLLGWFVGGWRLAASVLVCLLLIGLLGMWEPTIQSLVQITLAVIAAVIIGIPLGIWAGHSDGADAVIRVINDTLQTIPIFVYLVPVIMLFRGQEPAGVIAAVVYSLPPVIRLTSLGLRQTDRTVIEAAESFGSTGWQKLLKIEIPLALPSIMLGINQTIMMVLAMVIIAGFVGAAGLGLEVVFGFTNDNLGRSVEAGLAIVLLAIVIDRITQAWAVRFAMAANT